MHSEAVGPLVSLQTPTYLPSTQTQEPKDVVQNVMPPSLQLLNEELAKVVPGFARTPDPQLNGIKSEAEECFLKGYTKLVEDYMFTLQRGQALALAQAEAQGQGRYGGANL